MLTQAVARALDLEHDGMMEKSVQQCRRDHGVAKDIAPLGKTAIGRHDHGALFVAGVDQLEEEIAAARYDRQVADLVDDQ